MPRPTPKYPGPGEVLDVSGVPIYPGDLIRTPHFRYKGKWTYLYHVVVQETRKMTDSDKSYQYLRCLPYHWLERRNGSGGGDPILTQDVVDGERMKVVACSCADGIPYLPDRPRRRKA